MAETQLTLLKNGAILTIRHPERGADPAYTEQRVFRDFRALVERLAELWGEYSPDGD